MAAEATNGSPFAPPGDPLALDADAMRALGHQTVDALVDMLTDPSTPALQRATPAEMSRRLSSEPPEGPRGFGELVDQLQRDVFPFMSRLDHPGYFAFIPACGTFPSALGDFMAAVLNPYVGTWMEAAGPSRLELVVLDWFKRWIGYPSEAAGVLVSGGSAANLTALAVARESLLGPMSDDAVAYVCDQAHSSLARAARLLGFRDHQVRVLPGDEGGRLRPDALAEAIDADAEAGRKPLFVAGVAGSTNTGAVDPLPEIARVCRERGVWFHVDAAYGGFSALTERGRATLRGIEQADSVTLDPHKWLYQPFECGSLLVRDGKLLSRAFEIAPDYLKDAIVEDEEVNFADRGLQLSRGSRALKIWLSLSYFGVEAFREAIDRCLDLALLAQRHVEATPELELLSPASLGIIAFRRRGLPGEDEREATRRNAELVAAFERTGRGLVSSTRLHGRYAIRMCVMNHTTMAEHVTETLDWFAHAEVPAERNTPQRQSRTRARQLKRDKVELLARWARERRVPAGESVTRRWDPTREFYVILDGHAAVKRGDVTLAELEPGDFFGELAALDWGAGYGYTRLATVKAVDSLRLVVLSPSQLAELMSEAPPFDDLVRTAARERLPAAAA